MSIDEIDFVLFRKEVENMRLNDIKYRNKLLGLVLLLSFLTILCIQYPLLKDEYTIQTDARIHIWWMDKFQDKELFPYFAPTNILKNYGFISLYYIASFLIRPIWFNKLIPLLLLPLTIFFLFKIGVSLKDNVTGLLLAFLSILLYLSVFHEITSGLQRSFGVLFVIMALYFLFQQKYVMLTVSLLLECLFYPPAFLISGVMYLFSFFTIKEKHLIINLPKYSLIRFSITMLLCFTILSPLVKYQLKQPPVAYTFEESQDNAIKRQPLKVTEDPKYHKDGILPIMHFDYLLFGVLPLYFFIGPEGGIITNVYENMVPFLPFLLLAFMTFLIVKKPFSGFRKEIVAFFLSGIFLYAISWALFFGFSKFPIYHPARYIRFTFFTSILIFISVNFDSCVKRVQFLHRRVYFIIWMFVIVGIIIGLILSPDFVAKFSKSGIIDKYNLNIIRQTRIMTLFCSVMVFVILVIIIKYKSIQFDTFVKLFLVALSIIYLPLANIGKGAFVIPEQDRQLGKFLSNMPKNIMLVGHPRDVDNIPILCNRSVLFNDQNIYYETGVSRAVYDFVNAYYSNSSEVICEFLNKYKIDYLVVNEKRFTKEYLRGKRYYYEPENTVGVNDPANIERCVLNDPRIEKLFKTDHLFIVSAKYFRRGT
jgi:hypothetical protein